MFWILYILHADFIMIIWKIFGSTFGHYMDTIQIFGCIFGMHRIYVDNVQSMCIMYGLTTLFLHIVAYPQMLFVIFLFMGLSAVSFCLAFLFFLSSSLCQLSFSCSYKTHYISLLLTSTPFPCLICPCVISCCEKENRLKHLIHIIF